MRNHPFKHPHASNKIRLKDKTNALYIADKRLFTNDSIPGAGTFYLNEDLILTKKEMNKSCWNLNPNIFRNVDITYHPQPWKEDFFQSTARGQEYVIEENPKVEEWAINLIKNSKIQ